MLRRIFEEKACAALQQESVVRVTVKEVTGDGVTCVLADREKCAALGDPRLIMIFGARQKKRMQRHRESGNVPRGFAPGDSLFVRVLQKTSRTDENTYVVKAVQPEREGSLSLPDLEDQLRQEQNLTAAFDDRSRGYLRTLPRVIPEKALQGREDLRDLPFVTIDGADARDFDDAICVERTGDGWRLSVAIADVCHYLPRAKSTRKYFLDGEAFRRGTSLYFPTSVIPMLPFELSNDLCSLKPGQDRLVIVCTMTLTDTGERTAAEFCPAVICSRARLTYDQVYAALCPECQKEREEDLSSDRDDDHTAASLQTPPAPVQDDLLQMLEKALTLHRIIRQKRFRKGALDIRTVEPEYVVNQYSELVGLGFYRNHEIHELIEDFMIEANEACSEFLTARDLPFLYRVHRAPTRTAIQEFWQALAGVSGIPEDVLAFRDTGERNPHRLFQEILRRVRDTPHERIVTKLLLQAMPKAVYQPQKTGHFGLASASYCHFTSPIRRYADVMTHRALRFALGVSTEPILSGRRLEHTAVWINMQEKYAQNLEYRMQRSCACSFVNRYLKKRICRAMVTHLTLSGFFVSLLDYPVDGFVRLEPGYPEEWRWSPENDQYEEYRMPGGVSLGDIVSVRVSRVDFYEHRITFQRVD